MAGYAIGTVTAMVLGGKGLHFKYLLAVGFFFLFLSAVFMYFEVQTAGVYEHLKCAIITRTTDMVILYTLTTIYTNQRMPFKYLSTWICIMLTVYMAVGPSISGTVYTNVSRERQQHYITRYAQDVDLLNPGASTPFLSTVQGMEYQGKSKTEARDMAAISTKGRIQVQATLSTLKKIAGWAVYGGLICMIFVLIIPYPKRKLPTQRCF